MSKDSHFTTKDRLEQISESIELIVTSHGKLPMT